MNLRRSSVLLVVVTALLGVVVAAALIDTTTRLHVVARRVGTSVEGVRVSDQIALELASLRDAGDAVTRAAGEDDLAQLLREAQHYVDSPREQATLDQLTTAVDRYTTALDGVAGSSLATVEEQTRNEFEAAYATARALGRVNVEQSHELTGLAARLDRAANVIGVPAVLLFSIGLGAVAWWLQRRAFRPALELVGSIERYALGDRSSRAAERGPAEFRSIAHRFNDMASTLELQRDAQLAFLAGVAHDLRNPLAALKLTTAMITPEEPLPSEERVRQLFTRVERQIGRMERMVYDLLDAARIEAGNLQLQMERCDARNLVQMVVDLFEPAARAHHLVANIPEEPILVTCDPVRIEQVLTNLTSNAIKYSPRGGTVRVAVARDEKTVTISVSDEGVGMSADDLEHIFEPFRRASTADKAIPGVGLGLFVAHRVVEAHGGRLSVTSTLGKGSTFTVHLPAAT